jgi:hypothetical protein
MPHHIWPFYLAGVIAGEVQVLPSGFWVANSVTLR